jgi:hypothetical protein
VKRYGANCENEISDLNSAEDLDGSEYPCLEEMSWFLAFEIFLHLQGKCMLCHYVFNSYTTEEIWLQLSL